MKLNRSFVLAAALAACLAGFATASYAAEPCCNVVSVNAVTGVVTLRDLKTGAVFTVTVADKAKLTRLKPGQMVDRSANVDPVVPR